jgi:hypothetical protein
VAPARRKLDGVRRFGEIVIDWSHTRMTPEVRNVVVRLHRNLLEGADPDDWPLLCAELEDRDLRP